MRGTTSRRWATIAPVALVCLLSVASAACAGNTTMAGHPPPPDSFDWRWDASVGAATPQVAYARSAQFAPCRLPGDHMITAPDQSVTWLLSGPDVGIAYLRATCRATLHGNYLYRNLLVIVKGVQNTWYADGFQRRLPLPPAEDPTPTTAPGEAALSDLFPADTYLEGFPWRTSKPVALAGRAWISLTPRDYVLGLLQDSIIRPPDAVTTTVTTTVGRLPGWVTEANGMVTVVALRLDGVIFFFAGTGSTSEVEALAARVLPRAEEALGGPLSPAITPTP